MFILCYIHLSPFNWTFEMKEKTTSEFAFLSRFSAEQKSGKQAALGMRERGGRVNATPIANTSMRTMHRIASLCVMSVGKTLSYARLVRG